jgi:hypothetical protein
MRALAPLPPHLAEVAATLSPDLRALVDELPPRLVEVLKTAPTYSARPPGADLVSQHIVAVSPRTLEVWRLPWQRVNGRAITPTIALFAVAYAKLAAAPVTMGGRRSAEAQYAA